MITEEESAKFHGFAPVYNSCSRVLILGTWPSPQSRSRGFYYGHPQNRFWPLIAGLLNEQIPQTIDEKKQLLLMHHIALWDTLQSCTIVGARDDSIRNPIPNDIAGLLPKTDIRAVFCNGAASYRFYVKYAPDCDLPVVKLPSTSPANAAFSMERLRLIWGNELKKYLYN